MSNFLERLAERQYENKLPERYEEEPLFHCKCCGEDIFVGESYFLIDRETFCSDCVSKEIAEREEYEQ